MDPADAAASARDGHLDFYTERREHGVESAPESFPHRVLLMVTGLSPQVVTETLYALVTSEPAFVPTRIELITTTEGAERARLMLLDPDDGRYFQFCREYGLAPGDIDFGEHCIQAVEGQDGARLADITSEADNVAVANAVTGRVRALTAGETTALHASIAGGRKTMGFYLGYALSLFGRPQDRLSHVLVSQPFESDHQFYFPPAKPRRLLIQDRPVHTRDAEVMLADIPFVRLREGLPGRLVRGESTFSETVAAAQKALRPPEAIIVPGAGLWLGGEPVGLKPAEYAFYWWLADLRRRGLGPVRWDDPDAAQGFLAVYRRCVGEMSADYERAERALARGMDRGYFEQRRSRTNRAVVRALGESLAVPYAISPFGKRPRTRYGLTLAPERIRIGAARVRTDGGRQ